MDWPQGKVDAYLAVLVAEQARELDVAALEAALVNQPPTTRRLALVCLLALLVDIYIYEPVSTWVPERAARYEVFFRESLTIVEQYWGCGALDAEAALQQLEELFRLC